MNAKRTPSLAHWGAFTAVVEDGRLIACEPFARDQHSSPMLAAIPAMVHSPLRIARPAVRRGWLKQRATSGGSRRGDEPFVEVGWNEALALVAEELARVRADHGAEGIFGGSYGWSSAGRLHHARTLVRRFLFAGGGCVDQIGNYSWGAAQMLLPHIIGTYSPVTGRVTHWPSLARHTQLFVAFGGLALKNGQVNSGGCGEHSMQWWLRETRRNGARFVVISPTRLDCPDLIEAEWIPIRPNTDTALMLAMAHTLATEGLHDVAWLARYCVGFERLLPYLTGTADGVAKTAEWAEAITGVPAATTRELARRMARSRTLLSATWSLQRAHHGEQPYWMLIALAAMLGQIGLPGGGFGFGHGSIDGIGSPRLDIPGPTMPMGANPAGRAIPVARLADLLLHPGAEYDFNGERERYPDVRLVYWAGGNPFHHHQDLNRLRRAWSRPETVVVHDSWWTATARRADIVLPATTMVERNDLGSSSRDRYIIAMHRALAPIGQSRDDYEIFRELAARLGYEALFTEGRDETAWIRALYAHTRDAHARAGHALPEFDAFWQQGFVELPRPAEDFVLFADFRADPQKHRLDTPSGRIELYSERIAGFGYEDCPPHPTWLPPQEWLGAGIAKQYPLHLVTIQPSDRLHAQMDPGPLARANKVAGREKLRLHPQDAAERGIGAGDVVRVFNARGACLAGVELDAELVRGVAIMAIGAWFDPDDALAAGPERHGNANVLSFDLGTSKLAQGPSALSALVEVEKWSFPTPPVQAHTPPMVEIASDTA